MNENSILSEKIHKLLNRETANVDTYYNNESMWLIFTDSKKWVIELNSPFLKYPKRPLGGVAASIDI